MGNESANPESLRGNLREATLIAFIYELGVPLAYSAVNLKWPHREKLEPERWGQKNEEGIITRPRRNMKTFRLEIFRSATGWKPVLRGHCHAGPGVLAFPK